jgi:hypothetical protein
MNALRSINSISRLGICVSVHDFMAYNFFAGWSMHRRLACPIYGKRYIIFLSWCWWEYVLLQLPWMFSTLGSTLQKTEKRVYEGHHLQKNNLTLKVVHQHAKQNNCGLKCQ